MVIAYGISTLFFDSIFTAIVAMIRDICIENLSIQYPQSEYSQTDLTYHLSCAMVLITFYKLYSEPKMLSILNYIFTFWRIIQFNFMIDKILFLAFSIFFLRDIYRELYKKMDRIYFYWMNANIDIKEA